MSPESETCPTPCTACIPQRFLGVPLPRARRPRSGRVLSRGQACRATEPPSASRPIRVTAAHATKRHALSFNDRRGMCVEPALLAWPNRVGHTCEAPLVSTPLAASLPAAPSFPSCAARPSPPSMVRRCGSRRLRGNPPEGGSSTALRPCATQASLGCLRRLGRRDPAHAGGGIGLRRS